MPFLVTFNILLLVIQHNGAAITPNKGLLYTYIVQILAAAIQNISLIYAWLSGR